LAQAILVQSVLPCPPESLFAMASEQPKKPLTAFFKYLEEQRPAILKQLGENSKTKGIVAKTGAEQWRALSAADKSPYEEKAAAARVQYEAAVQSFKATGGEMVRKRKADKDDEKPKKDKDAPKKPAGGGYGQYLAENRSEIVKSLPAGSNLMMDVAKAAGANWKALSVDAKKPYEEKFVLKMKEFKIAMESYNVSKSAANEEVEEEEELETPSPKPSPKRAKLAEKLTSPKEMGTPVALLGA